MLLIHRSDLISKLYYSIELNNVTLYLENNNVGCYSETHSVENLFVACPIDGF